MNLGELLSLVDGYHITDKRLLRTRAAVERTPNEETERQFRKEAARYFAAVAREAQEQLIGVDRRLDDVYQRQYNLHAERAVVERRLEGARALMKALGDDHS